MYELGSVLMVLCCGGYLLLTIDSEYNTISFDLIRLRFHSYSNSFSRIHNGVD